ncbi:glycoside hydrolase family 172 protein [Parabacteroides pacaensis]|uniref:glycoside hydrolase family 172 protein n=1 Tax=Parabacteroides pacaensis TaxID=2086575 RepID=UPI000D108164|nr:glycoside hydrolase family 172 protein [Parabacteroides pacaensis]
MKRNVLRTVATALLGILLLNVCVTAQENVSGELYDLAKIKKGVRNRRISSYDRTGGNGDALNGIKAGETRTIAEIKGAGVINHIWITIAPGPDRLCRNDIILRMYWDNNDYPSVESPIGPFFGQGWNEQYNYASFPLSAGPGNGTGLSCYFTMPFAEGARIEIENQADHTIDAFYYYVDYVEMAKLPKDMGRFHAWYNHELTEALPDGENEWGTLGPQQANTDGARNYVFADIQGKGHFVGINYYVHNPSPMWYGEGDDMWFIDGEEKASLIGTGTEDFFNTSWCPKETFSHPYFGYPRVNNDVGWLGRTHVYRFFINDPVYFDTALKATIEHGHNDCLTLDLASVAYWYQDKASALPKAPTKEERRLKPMIGPSEIHKWRHEWRKNKGNNPQAWGNE